MIAAFWAWVRDCIDAFAARRKRRTYIRCGFIKTEEDPRGSISISRRILNR